MKIYIVVKIILISPALFQLFEYLTGDEETRRLAFLRQKAIMDERDAMSRAKNEGIKEVALKMLKKGLDIDTIIELTDLTKDEIEKLK